MKTLSLFAALGASASLLFMAAFIMIKDWRDQVNRYFVLWNLSAFTILFTMFLTYLDPLSEHLTLYNKLTQAATVLTFASFLVMSLVFPKREQRFPLQRAFFIFIPAVLVALAIVIFDLTITRAYFAKGRLMRDLNPVFYYIYSGISFSYLLAGIISFVRKYISTRIEIFRLQMRYVFIGAGVGMFLAAVASIILPSVFGISDYYVLGPAAASFFTTAALFYSVTSYNLMNIRTVIHKTVMYTVLSISIGVPILLVVLGYDRNVLGLGAIQEHIMAASLSILFIGYALYIQPRIDRFFRREQVEFENIVNTFIRDVYKLQDFDSVVRRTLDLLHDSLYLNSSFFLLYNDRVRVYEPVHYHGYRPQDLTTLDRNSSLILWFQRNAEILQRDRIHADPAFEELHDILIDFYETYDLRIILPVYHDNRLLGLICLGQKESLAAFSTDEIEKLEFFRSKSNDFISTALTYRKAMEEQFVTRTVDLSARIQGNALPVSLPNTSGIKFGAFLIPRYKMGADFFDFIRPGDQGVGIIATDISGIGISSSLYSVVVRSAVQGLIHEAPSTYSFMQKLNRVLWEYTKGMGALITAQYIFYDSRNSRLMHTNAGFPALELFRVEKNDFDSLDTEGIPLGNTAQANYGIGRTNLQRGDIGTIYSKSLINSRNQKGESFGLLRLRRVISENRSRRPMDICEELKNTYNAFMGLSSPTSDVTVIVFKII